MSQAHWIRDARYQVELLDGDGDTIRRCYARNLDEVRTELLVTPGAVVAKTNELRTGQARVIRRRDVDFGAPG